MMRQSLSYEQAMQCEEVLIDWPDYLWADKSQPILRVADKWRMEDAMKIKFAADCGYRITEAS
jgi:hypothetical protein